MSIRAKFRCHTVTTDAYANETVKLGAVYGDGKDNQSWSKATPSGDLTMCISNPEAHGKSEPGKDYYLDFTPAG